MWAGEDRAAEVEIRMKRWIAFVAVLYPRSWRDEFGDEFGALLDDVKPSWRVFRNVLGGAIQMQITEGTNWMKVAGKRFWQLWARSWQAGLSYTSGTHAL